MQRKEYQKIGNYLYQHSQDLYIRYRNETQAGTNEKALFAFIHDLVTLHPDQVKAILDIDRTLLDAVIYLNKEPITLLHTAAKVGCINLVCYLLEQGCIINPENKDDSSPLALAVDHGHIIIVRLLLKFGANPNVNLRGSSLVDFCLTQELNNEILASLLAYGAEGQLEIYKNEMLNEYSKIKPFIQKAQSINPENLIELTKALLDAYINHSLFYKNNDDHGLLKWINENPYLNFDQVKSHIYSMSKEFAHDELFVSLTKFICRDQFKCFLLPIKRSTEKMTKELLRSIGDMDSWELIDKFINNCELNDFGTYWEIMKHTFLMNAIRNNNSSLVYTLIKIDSDLPGTMQPLVVAIECYRVNILRIILNHGVNPAIELHDISILELFNAKTNPIIFSMLINYGNFELGQPPKNCNLLVEKYYDLHPFFKIAQQTSPAKPIDLARELLIAYTKQTSWYQKQCEPQAHELLQCIEQNPDNFIALKSLVNLMVENKTIAKCKTMTAICEMMLDNGFTFFVVPEHLEKNEIYSPKQNINQHNFHKEYNETTLEFTIRIEHELRSLACDEDSLRGINIIIEQSYSSISDISTKQPLITNFDWVLVKSTLMKDAISTRNIKFINSIISAIGENWADNENFSKRTILYALDNNQIEAAKELLKLGILKNKPNLAEEILDHAIQNSNLESVSILLETDVTRENILFRQMKICIAHAKNTLQIYMKLVAYGAEINSNDTDDEHIARRLSENNPRCEYYKELLIFKYQYLAIDKLMRQAQQSNPKNLIDLIKGLLNAYLDRSIFMTSNYKDNAKDLLYFISNYNGNDLLPFIFDKIIKIMNKEFSGITRFRETYENQINKIVELNNTNYLISEIGTKYHELLHPPLANLSDPFYVLCEFIIERKAQLEWFLKPTPLLCKDKEIVITNNANNNVELTTNEKSPSMWDRAVNFFVPVKEEPMVFGQSQSNIDIKNLDTDSDEDENTIDNRLL